MKKIRCSICRKKFWTEVYTGFFEKHGKCNDCLFDIMIYHIFNYNHIWGERLHFNSKIIEAIRYI